MSTIVGFSANQIEAQPGFTATRGANGGWTGRHSFAIKRTAWASGSTRGQFAKGTAITSLDSEVASYFAFLKVVEVEVVSEEGDWMMIATTLAGTPIAQYDEEITDAAEPTYRLSGSLQDAPFSIHPKWKLLTPDQKSALGFLLDGTLHFEGDTEKIVKINQEASTKTTFFDPFLPYAEIIIGDALEFAKLIAAGESTYLRPTFTWTEMTQGTSKLSGAQINKLGRIAVPRGGPPTPEGERNWMLTGAMQEEVGEVITTDLEWTLSEKSGHSAFLYDE